MLDGKEEEGFCRLISRSFLQALIRIVLGAPTTNSLLSSFYGRFGCKAGKKLHCECCFFGAEKLVNVSKALVYAHNDGRFHVLKNSTAGVMFFGTPHRGSEHIKYGGVLQKLANITAKRDISVMKKLQRDSDTLARLNLESRHQLSRYKVFSFYETLETAIGPFTSLVKCSVKRSTSDILT